MQKRIFLLLTILHIGLSGFLKAQSLYPIQWTNVVGITVSANQSLTKVGANGWTSGAASTNLLKAGVDGSIQFTITSVTGAYMFGLSKTDKDVNFTTIDYAIAVSSGVVTIYESGTPISTGVTAAVNDVFKIVRTNNVLQYFRGATELRNLTLPNTYNSNFMVDASLYSGTTPIVQASFDASLNIAHTVTPVGYGGTGGSIAVSVSQGTPPYTYLWSSGEATSGITNKVAGTYTVTVSDASGRTGAKTVTLGYKSSWTDLVGGVAVDATNRLTKTGNNAWDAGAASTNVLRADTDGSIEFAWTSSMAYEIGLSRRNLDASYTSIEYSIYVANGDITILESGANVSGTGNFGRAAVGDVFRIEKSGPSIKYYHNGMLLRTVAYTAFGADFMIDVSVYHDGAVVPTVIPTFDSQIQIRKKIAPVEDATHGGSILLSPVGGTPPYSYNWGAGGTTNKIENKPVGTYAVTVTDAEGRSASTQIGLGYKVDWTQVSSRLDILEDNSLVRYAAVNTWYGASSLNMLMPGADGWIEFEIGRPAGDYYDIGLSVQDIDGSSSSIENGLVCNGSGSVIAYQKDLPQGVVALLRVGDVYRIAREGGYLNFYRNGVSVRSVAINASQQQIIEASIYQGATPVIYSSFDSPLVMTPVFKAPDANGKNAGITMSISGGKAPYAVSWSTGETGVVLSGKQAGTSVVATVTDASGRTATHTYTIGYPAQWGSLSNMVRDKNYDIKKTGTTNASNAGAFSRNKIAAGKNGAIQFVAPTVFASYVLGLASTNTAVSGADTEFGFYIVYPTGAISIFEKSVKQYVGYVQPGDVFEIRRETAGGVTKMNYYINGLQKWSTTTTLAKDLYADVSMYSASGAVPSVAGDFEQSIVTVDQTIRNNWAFEYRYDARKRMIAKKAPGAEWTYMIYDNRDRLVLTQDANQRPTNEWSFTKYDILNRPVMTGLYKCQNNTVVDAVSMQAFVNSKIDSYDKYYETYDGSATNFGYTNRTFPDVADVTTVGLVTPLIVTYYDDYQFKTLYADPRFDLVSNHLSAYSPQESANVKGQITGTSVRSLNDATSWMRSVSYYDDKYRVIQTVAEDHEGKVSRTTSQYDFVGKVTKTQTTAHQSYDVVWARLANCMLDNETNKVTYNGTQSWGAGASSSQVLAASQNGWVESVYDGTSVVMMGLTDVDADAGYTKILFAAYTTSLSKLYAYASGTQTGFLGDIKKGDVIRVERIATRVYVKVNGEVRHLFPSTSVTPLIVDMSLTSGSIHTARASFGADKSLANTLQWGYSATVSLVNGTITKTATSNVWSGAAGTLNVLSGTGWMQFKALETTTARAAGLASSSPISVPNQLDFGFYLKVGGTFDVVEGSQTVASGTYAVNDVFRIETTLENGHLVLTYSKTGGFSVRSATLPTKSYRAQAVLNTKSSTIGELSVSFPVPLTEQKIDIFNRLDYDHAGRLTKTWQKTSGDANEILLVANDYNELGQLITKKLHNTDPADPIAGPPNTSRQFKQSVDYRYNIRGWLTRINKSDLSADDKDNVKDLFGMELGYEKPMASVTSIDDVAYNGNISATRWSNNLGLGGLNNPTQRAYRYSYDAMNRLNSAEHLEQNLTWAAVPSFKEAITSYDLNGNIRGLERTGKNGQIDNLTYNYGADLLRSNKLMSVSDASVNTEGFKDGANTALDYSYDPNGNMVSDLNKDVQSIVYNHLNLPARVNKTNGEYVKYIYDATGRKLTQQVFDAQNAMTKRSDYIGPLFLENDTLKFVNHGEGRIIPAKTKEETNEYQYHLKDHLGNVRLTFTTKPETDAGTATLEPAKEAEEKSKFLFVDEAVKVNSELFNHTPNSTTKYSTRLSGFANERTGLARSLSVMPGDVIHAEVYAKYVDPSHSNWQSALTNLMSAIAQGGAGSPVIDGGAQGSLGIYVFPYDGLVQKGDESTEAPRGYLNWIIFDREDHFLDGGAIQMVADAGKEDGTNVSHQKIEASFEIKQPGYVFVYLSNDSFDGEEVEVFFDDFRVEQIKSPVVQQDDYYPFGLTYNSHRREYSVPNRYQYNGKELQDALGLNWNDYGARMYMSDIGRWGVVDPLADKMRRFSPYNYAFDNPVRFIDPDGMGPKDQTNPDQNKEPTLLDKFVQGLYSFFSGVGSNINNLTGNKDASDQENLETGLMFMAQMATAPMEAEQMVMEAGESSETAIASKVDDVAEGASAIKPISYVFRGDTRPPSQIFAEGGFTARGTNMDLLEHAMGNPINSGYIPTSKSPRTARRFAGEGGYVYTIGTPVGSVDVNAALGAKAPFPNELEVAVPLAIPASKIAGARKIGPNLTFTGPYIPNNLFKR
ncbi:RHS repeat-associated core domain-containing protein [Chryseolinea lacunae]|uniref:RHS repeat-associated core domain-containing protein n=1 Tax=Chryseolinea lacunae TaxID=2801331 RepID=A0ABS1KQ70_9BACT|nr:RHS repeat-associated core domain-containing protein [Chryseolinea lacunae]MBL0741392.1 hypothetical protein [Chryseolinea lacunae]